MESTALKLVPPTQPTSIKPTNKVKDKRFYIIRTPVPGEFKIGIHGDSSGELFNRYKTYMPALDMLLLLPLREPLELETYLLEEKLLGKRKVNPHYNSFKPSEIVIMSFSELLDSVADAIDHLNIRLETFEKVKKQNNHKGDSTSVETWMYVKIVKFGEFAKRSPDNATVREGAHSVGEANSDYINKYELGIYTNGDNSVFSNYYEFIHSLMVIIRLPLTNPRLLLAGLMKLDDFEALEDLCMPTQSTQPKQTPLRKTISASISTLLREISKLFKVYNFEFTEEKSMTVDQRELGSVKANPTKRAVNKSVSNLEDSWTLLEADDCVGGLTRSTRGANVGFFNMIANAATSGLSALTMFYSDNKRRWRELLGWKLVKLLVLTDLNGIVIQLNDGGPLQYYKPSECDTPIECLAALMKWCKTRNPTDFKAKLLEMKMVDIAVDDMGVHVAKRTKYITLAAIIINSVERVNVNKFLLSCRKTWFCINGQLNYITTESVHKMRGIHRNVAPDNFVIVNTNNYPYMKVDRRLVSILAKDIEWNALSLPKFNFRTHVATWCSNESSCEEFMTFCRKTLLGELIGESLLINCNMIGIETAIQKSPVRMFQNLCDMLGISERFGLCDVMFGTWVGKTSKRVNSLWLSASDVHVQAKIFASVYTCPMVNLIHGDIYDGTFTVETAHNMIRSIL